jgi:hypothetical protein
MNRALSAVAVSVILAGLLLAGCSTHNAIANGLVLDREP